MPLVQTSPPSIEPVSLADVKANSRVIDTSDDTLIPVLIGTARRYAESVTNRSFITQGWKLVMDSFPGGCSASVPWGTTYSFPENAILLDKGNVLSIASITYLAMDGTQQTMPSTDYIADLSGCPARITPVFGKIWPIPMPQIGSVQVNYTAGYGPAATDVPEGIRHWILMRVASIFENREEAAILARGKLEPLPWVDTLLDPYCVVTA
jgi:uncharacterized phiE125 gp8 family phage protein